MSEQNQKEPIVYRFLHKLAGRRYTVPEQIQKALVAVGEKRVVRFGGDKIFSTKSKKVSDYLKTRGDHGKDFNYITSAAEVEAQKEVENTLLFIQKLRTLPSINIEAIVDGLDETNVKLWCKAAGIEGNASKKALKENLVKVETPKVQPQDTPASILAKQKLAKDEVAEKKEG